MHDPCLVLYGGEGNAIDREKYDQEEGQSADVSLDKYISCRFFQVSQRSEPARIFHRPAAGGIGLALATTEYRWPAGEPPIFAERVGNILIIVMVIEIPGLVSVHADQFYGCLFSQRSRRHGFRRNGIPGRARAARAGTLNPVSAPAVCCGHEPAGSSPTQRVVYNRPWLLHS
jgi:hypothetical protein